MKEQILRLDPHDDYNSARDKMGWTQTSRVLLVWPAEGGVLSRRLDLLLLHRHANRLGAHLALITTDPVVREHARELGLPAFESVDASRHTRWRSRASSARVDRQRPRPDLAALRRPLPRARLPVWASWLLRGVVFAAALTALAVLAAALVPGATVTLTPANLPVTTHMELVADPAVSAVSGAAIPARQVRVEVEAEGRTATTGRIEVPSSPATGAVIFTSLDGTATAIPGGTGVRTTGGQPVRFRTTRAVELAPRIGATATASIVAVDLGPAGNVRPGLINAIDGPLGLQLAVTNLAPTAGGASTTRAAVAARDRARLRHEVMQRLQSDAHAAIQSNVQPGEFLAADSVSVTRVVAETYTYGAGEQADTVALTLRIAAVGIAVAEADAQLAAEQTLATKVPAGQVLLAGSNAYSRDPELRLDEQGRVHISVTASAQAVPLIDRELVREAVKGQTLPAAQARLARLPIGRPAEIQVWPAWYERLPWMPFRIDVVLRSSGT